MKKILLTFFLALLLLAGCTSPQSNTDTEKSSSLPLVSESAAPVDAPDIDIIESLPLDTEPSASEDNQSILEQPNSAPNSTETSDSTSTISTQKEPPVQSVDEHQKVESAPVSPQNPVIPPDTSTGTEENAPGPEKQSSTVYWTDSGEVYHSTEGCRSLARSKNIQSGSIGQSGKDRGCKNCVK